MLKMILGKSKNQAKNRQSSIKNKFIFIFLLLIFCSLRLHAQCAMCRASLESEGNTVKAEAVNDGIVYLMVIPYVLVAVVGLVVYRMYRKKQQ